MSDLFNNTESKFRGEDFEEINDKYFKEIRRNKEQIVDPSGWQDTFTPVESFLGPKDFSIHKYNTDFENQLKKEKEIAKVLINEWDSIDYSIDNFTFCHSVTIGSLIILSSLSKLGIKTIYFETPCYYATLYQAKDLGLNVILLPSYYQDNFEIKFIEHLPNSGEAFAVWLTQPRTALGYNQNKQQVSHLLSLLRTTDYLIVDEATEQYFPSHLAEFRVTDYNLIKIRSFFKGMGLNGIRLSYIAHPLDLREKVMEEMEIYQGALDMYSLDFLSKNAKEINRFKLMLESSTLQVRQTRDLLRIKTINNNFVAPSEIANGYIGCLFLNYETINLKHDVIRKKLLEFSSKNKMPLILGSSMRFAIHDNMEFIRLNYYNRFMHLSEAIDKLDLFFSGIS